MSEDSKMVRHFYIKSSGGDSIVDSDFHGCRHRAASPLCPVPHRELPCCRVSGLVLHGGETTQHRTFILLTN